MIIRSKNIVRAKFPKVYEYNHPKSGTYYLVDEGHLVKKPTDGIRIKADDFKGEFYTPTETKQLLLHIVKNNKELIGFYALQIFGGLRRSEASRIQWEQINLKTNQLHVRKGKTLARYVTLQ